MRGTCPTIANFEDEGHHKPGKCGSLQKLRTTPSQHPTQETRPQSYNCMELNSATDMNEFGSEFFFRASGKEHNTADSLMSAL